MASSDWLALGGVIVSCLAFAVSFVAYRLQARSAQSDNEKELADQINAIQDQLAELSPVPQPTGSIEALTRADSAAQQAQAMAAIIKTTSVNGALQALLLRVGTLIESAKLEPDWYQNLVLATAAVQIGDPITAEPYTRRAVELARTPTEHGWDAGTAATAEMQSLRVRANFYFNRGLPGDLKRARGDFDAARQLVEDNRSRQGPFVTAGRLIELYVRQTDFELDLGDNDCGIALMAEACREWQKIQIPSGRQVTGSLIVTLASSQRAVPISTLLTSEFITEWGELQRGFASAQAVRPGKGSGPEPDVDLSTLHPFKVSAPPGPQAGARPAPEVATPGDSDR
jgi:hypothetical protein